MITHFFIDARIGPSCNITCDFVIQFKIQNALVKCFNDATEVSSEKFKMANNTEELTKVTCELISDMGKCHDIDKIPLHLCYSSNEIQNKKDILEINSKYIKGLTFHYVDKLNEVIDIALLSQKVDNFVEINV